MHTTVLDMKINYYPRNVLEAQGRVEYCILRVVINLISNTVACYHQYIKILTEVECSWGGTRLVTRNLRTFNY